MTRSHLTLPACALVLLAACGGKERGPAAESSAASPPAAPAGSEQTPDPGRKVVVIEMLTDAQGNNIFRPANFEVHRGDVVRYTLVAGVHNVHFLPDSNPGVAGLPPAADMLQLPGQTWDLKVALPKGRYYFQCDPHALLGMVGHMKVEEEDGDEH